jgi:hypothetical protein
VHLPSTHTRREMYSLLGTQAGAANRRKLPASHLFYASLIIDIKPLFDTKVTIPDRIENLSQFLR